MILNTMSRKIEKEIDAPESVFQFPARRRPAILLIQAETAHQASRT